MNTASGGLTSAAVRRFSVLTAASRCARSTRSESGLCSCCSCSWLSNAVGCALRLLAQLARTRSASEAVTAAEAAASAASARSSAGSMPAGCFTQMDYRHVHSARRPARNVRHVSAYVPFTRFLRSVNMFTCKENPFWKVRPSSLTGWACNCRWRAAHYNTAVLQKLQTDPLSERRPHQAPVLVAPPPKHRGSRSAAAPSEPRRAPAPRSHE